jgi:hypothetical protein
METEKNSPRLYRNYCWSRSISLCLVIFALLSGASLACRSEDSGLVKPASDLDAWETDGLRPENSGLYVVGERLEVDIKAVPERAPSLLRVFQRVTGLKANQWYTLHLQARASSDVTLALRAGDNALPGASAWFAWNDIPLGSSWKTLERTFQVGQTSDEKCVPILEFAQPGLYAFRNVRLTLADSAGKVRAQQEKARTKQPVKKEVGKKSFAGNKTAQQNVSTLEVAEAVNRFPGVKDTTVYGVGVEGVEGRAGMAVIVCDNCDLAALHSHIENSLPEYARPVFLRMRKDIDVTTTFKQKKVDLVKEGFDPSKIGDAIYFNDPQSGTFVQLDPALYQRIEKGEIRL